MGLGLPGQRPDGRGRQRRLRLPAPRGPPPLSNSLERGTPIPSSPKVDTASTALTVTGLGALVYAIIEAPTRGWGDPLVLGMLGAAVLLIAALVLREGRVERPMLDMSLLAHRGFLFNTVAATLVTFILTGLLFVLPPYLQAVLGHDALGTGVRLLPMMGGAVALDHRPRLRPLAHPCHERRPERPAPRPCRLGSPHAFLRQWGRRRAADDHAPGRRRDRHRPARSLLAATFRDRLDVTGLPARASDTAGESVVAAHLVAERAGSADLMSSANSAYVHGMGVVLLVCGVAALVSALLAAAFLPGAPRPARTSTPPDMAGEQADARQ